MVLAALLALGGLGLVGAARPAEAASPAPRQATLVSDVPTATTPHVTNGDVRDVAVVGSSVVLGGNFTTSTDPDGTVVDRTRLLAYDKATGQIRRDWAPQVDGDVVSLVAAPDGQSVYVGGRFNRVNGAIQYKVARIAISDGRNLPFQSGFNGLVTAMALQGNRLYVGGTFTTVQGRTRRFVALNASTGVIDDGVDVAFAGTHNGGDGRIWTIEASPDGAHLVVVGSFATVGGQPRNQVVKLDTNGGGAVTVSPWSTSMFAPVCSGFPDYVRDVSFSPDGRYFVVVSTGFRISPGNYGGCDAVVRFENNASSEAPPSWIEYSGGDSYYSVEVTGAAVYVGGHFRWSNNPFGSDTLGEGGSATSGIAALDPANGLPLSWNPGRTRGHAVWRILATPDGLYVASDTDRIAGYRYRGRIAFFPLAGGRPVPQPARFVLPLALDQLVPAAGGAPARVTTRHFDGTTVATPQTAVSDAPALAGVRAAFTADGKLYTAHADGTLKARPYDGRSLGAPVDVDLQRMASFASDLANMNGALYDAGRLYYTVAGSDTLYMRYFSVENRVVGAQRFDVASSAGGLSYSQVGGMVLAGGSVTYVDRAAGTLVKATWLPGGGIDPSTRTTVSGAGADGLSWTDTVLWARQGSPPPPPPTADRGFVAAASSPGQPTATTHRVVVPPGVRAGDQLLLTASSNAPGGTAVGAPAGWTRVLDADTSGSRTALFRRTATATDAGTTLTVTVGMAARVDLVVGAYRGLTLGTSGAAFATGYTTPSVSAPAGAWVVSYWADKSSTTTGWTAPAGVTVRHSKAGTGSGHVSELLGDGVHTSAGPTASRTATVASPVFNSVALTIVLTPTP